MIVLERHVAQLFRAALRRCVDAPSTRADRVPVLLRHGKNGLMMHARQEEFAVMYSQPGPEGKEVLAFPASSLGLIEGKSQEPIELVAIEPGKAAARWVDKGVHLEIDFPVIESDKVAIPPALPKEFAPMPVRFLTALHEASRTASQAPTKYSIHRVLLRGKTGEILATDTHQLLIQSGFKFPFQEDLLIPRSGVFGLPALAPANEIGIGRTDTHVAIRVGRWIFAFLIDVKGRFPDARGLVPRTSSATTRFRLDPEDAEFFMRMLTQRLRGPKAKDLALTLDLNETPCFRFDVKGRTTDIVLPRSQVTGKAIRLCIDLKRFLRAIELQFSEFEFSDPDKPFVARDEQRIYLAMTSNSKDALAPHADALRLVPAHEPTTTAVAVRRTRPQPLARVEPDRAAPTVVVLPTHALSPTHDHQSLDVFAEAEGLRSAVIKAAAHAGRLLHLLRTVCLQPNVMQTMRNSLHALTHPSFEEQHR